MTIPNNLEFILLSKSFWNRKNRKTFFFLRKHLIYRKTLIYIYIYILLTKIASWKSSTKVSPYRIIRKPNSYKNSRFKLILLLALLVLSSSVIVALQGSRKFFSFFLTNWLRIPWFFSRGRTKLAFSFFLTYNFFFFPWAVIRDTLSLVSGVFFFWYRECW